PATMSDQTPSSRRSDAPSSRFTGPRLLAAAALLLLCGAGLTWWMQTRESSAPLRATRDTLPATPPKTGIVTTAIDSHAPIETQAPDGTARVRPADPALEEALSLTSGLPYAVRLKTVHALQGRHLTEAQAGFLRSFVADPALPEGITIYQIRALKNDI